MDMRPADSGIEFLVGAGLAGTIFSCVHSSLWSAQNFGRTPETAKSCLSYSHEAAGVTLAFAAVGSIITRSPYAFLGAAAFTGYMLLGYRRSLARNGYGSGADSVQSTPRAIGGTPAVAPGSNPSNVGYLFAN